MRRSALGLSALAIGLAAAVLGGCGAPNTANTVPLGASLRRAAHKASRANEDLLYVSDLVTNEVYAFKYPKGKKVLTLRGFTNPWGVCSDAGGNVFVLGYRNDNVIEYAHGSTKPLQTLDVPGWSLSCSYDPNTGNLAVLFFSYTYGDGIAVFASEAGTPTTFYAGPGIGMASCGYDDSSNLFCNGGTETQRVTFFVLASGSNHIVNIPVSGEFYDTTEIQWDGQYMAVLDTSFDTVTRINFQQVSSDPSRIDWVGKVVSATSLQGCGYDNARYSWIYKGSIIVPCVHYSEHRGRVKIWNYPAGGKPTELLPRKNGTFPDGVTVSVAPSR